MVIEAFLIVDYTISVLKCFLLWKYGRGCSWATPKLWAWLCVEPPLLKFLEITTALTLSYIHAYACMHPFTHLKTCAHSPYLETPMIAYAKSRFLQNPLRKDNTSLHHCQHATACGECKLFCYNCSNSDCNRLFS